MDPSDRVSIAKIKNQLVEEIKRPRGIDMGNGFSPWTFCFAIDPWIRRLNRTPKVISCLSCKDNTDTLGVGISWIKKVIRTYDSFAFIGLHTVKHKCGQVTCRKTSGKIVTHKGPSLHKCLNTRRKTRSSRPGSTARNSRSEKQSWQLTATETSRGLNSAQNVDAKQSPH